MTNATLNAWNEANYYKALYVNAQSALASIQIELDSIESHEMLVKDIEYIIRRAYEKQLKLGAKKYVK